MSMRIHERGQLLLEVLIVTTLAAAVILLGSQITNIALKGTRGSGEQERAGALAAEVFDAVRASSTEKWQNLYQLTKPSAHYYPAQSSGKWVLNAGDETVTIDGIAFTRYFTVDNVSRDSSTRNIEAAYNAANDDPSTQLVTVNVSWVGGTPLIVSEYVTRWRNKVCVQTAWTGVGAGPATCPATNYGAQTNIDTSVSGQLKLTPQ